MILDAWGWCTGMTQTDGMGREGGGGFRMGNMCAPVEDSCWCMAKPIEYCKVISLQLKHINLLKKKKGGGGNKFTRVKVSEAQAGMITGAGNCKQGLPMKSSQIASPRLGTVTSGFVYNKGFSHFLVSRTLHILKKCMEDCKDLLFMWVIAINSNLIKNWNWFLKYFYSFKITTNPLPVYTNNPFFKCRNYF